MHKLITELKNAGQDFEFYPTSSEIVSDIHTVLNGDDDTGSLLDIGAGNGILFKQLRDLDREYNYSFTDAFAIEKSQHLVEQMESNVFVLGTNFHQQTLIDKEVKTIFCNPPYSEYEQWTTRIIKEGNCKTILLVIPERWVNSDSITKALEQRNAKTCVIGSYSFEDSEFRKARAKVNLVKVQLNSCRWSSTPTVDPFNVFYNEHFKPEKVELTEEPTTSHTKNSLHDVVKGKNLIETLVSLYTKELSGIQETFNNINSLDPALLEELGVDQVSIRESLRVKYRGLKSLYWNELFNNLKKITNRLTKKTRSIMIEQLIGNTSVDFTAENAYAIVIWSLKNCNKYIDEQLVSVFKWLSTPEYVTNYKSNDRFLNEKWRFYSNSDDNPYTHYMLDYRIITDCFMFGESWREPTGKDNLNDIFVIAGNLGFDIVEDAFDINFKRGKSFDIHYMEDGEEKLFCQCRFYANGNGHFKFNKDFMMKMNIEVGRILKWVHTPKDASVEMKIPESVITDLFNSNIQLGMNNIKLIGN